jgi:hypothetical protein
MLPLKLAELEVEAELPHLPFKESCPKSVRDLQNPCELAERILTGKSFRNSPM